MEKLISECKGVQGYLQESMKDPEVEFQIIEKKDEVILYISNSNLTESFIYFSYKEDGKIHIRPVNASNEIQHLCHNYKHKKSALKIYEHAYIGVDESGKGDYFGPLVVAGFVSDSNLDEVLIDWGIKDCKKLSDKKVMALGKELMDNYGDRCYIYPLIPDKYNMEISLLKMDGKNQMDLLARAHDQVIDQLLNRTEDIEGVVADAVNILTRGKSMRMQHGHLVQTLETIKGENNMAVAAAGVLARFTFLKALSDMTHVYGLSFPKGASLQVIRSGRNFIAENGRKELRKVAKIHYKTTQRILGGMQDGVKPN